MSGHLSPSRDEVRETVRELRRHLGLFSFQNDAPTVEPSSKAAHCPSLVFDRAALWNGWWRDRARGRLPPPCKSCRDPRGRGIWAIVDPARECYVPAFSGWGIDPSRVTRSPPGDSSGSVLGDRAMPALSRVCRPPGPGSTSGFPRAFIAAGNWRRKWAEAWACFFGRSRRDGNRSGPTYDCWSRRRLEAREKPDGCGSRCCIAGAAWEAAPRSWEIDHAAGLVRLVPEVADPTTAERAARA